MRGPRPQPGLSVEVDANVIRQLGEELITDAEQALLELIKNSYDADAQVCRVIVDTEDPCDGVDIDDDLSGSIVVEDDGVGMDLRTIEKGWLTISLSLKRSIKEQGKRTERFHRTPLGDKGLGRLGTMKIGDTLDIVTHSVKGAEGYRVRLSWDAFRSGTPLSHVPVEVERVPPAKKTGTRLTIFGLRERDYWRGRSRQQGLVDSMSMLVSPFQQFSNFRISFRVDGSALELHEIGDDVRNGSTARFAFDWTGEKLTCTASMRLSLVRGSTDGDEYEELVAADKGRGFRHFLQASGRVRGNLETSADGPWFAVVRLEVPSHEVLPAGAEDPGPFTGELDAFELDSPDVGELFSNAGEYKAYIKRFAGVSVFRDHFAVRMAEDWLGLGRSWTSGRSYYGLKPANTIGYFELSASSNPRLREKSDREGFLDTRAWRGFEAITKSCIEFANSALTDVRRAFLRFRDEQRASKARLPTAWAPQDAVTALGEARRSAARARATVAATDQLRKASVVRVRDSLRRLIGGAALPAAQEKAAAAVVEQLGDLVAEWEKQRAHTEAQLDALREDQALTTALLGRFEQFKRQLSDVYEMVALGLVAEGIAHEMEGILEDLVQRTNRAAPRAKRSGDAALVGYLEAVRSTVSTLRKQVSILDPMLRTTREQRSTFAMSQFVHEFVELRQKRLELRGIRAVARIEDDFVVRMSRGRLLQVLDNLCRNSEYWLRQGHTSEGARAGEIVFAVARPMVIVSDTGPGVKPDMERVLFEPFVSGKPRGEGRGLGLFIARQLLQRDGCDLSLESERNRKGRRYRFAVNLAGVEQKP
jgi:signal transduction histidine kinase